MKLSPQKHHLQMHLDGILNHSYIYATSSATAIPVNINIFLNAA
jgi:hypothetical protein